MRCVAVCYVLAPSGDRAAVVVISVATVAVVIVTVGIPCKAMSPVAKAVPVTEMSARNVSASEPTQMAPA